MATAVQGIVPNVAMSKPREAYPAGRTPLRLDQYAAGAALVGRLVHRWMGA